jgi:hypothetical protein
MVKEPTVIDELFLLYSDGRLIKHRTRRLKPDRDDEILSSMLVAVRNFVKDSFRDSASELDELKLGEFKIVIGKGKWVIIAAVLLGEETLPFRQQVLNAIKDLERKHEDVLSTWNGNMDRVAVLDEYLKDLIEGKYR